ncbi:TldD/PmbA family protein [Candidatus Formimonas warabiya]|uniref:Peptidase C69 n=1 Tax=Formimonas warabiya TaxID=1761012 RepID=A0A3G1KNK3_FORW1|nr:TldD/PmbA family protein [Candidatus Formimonas warabiya]ATW24006.1 peptidase C69 [Candidatus Formimonas warabiya]
MLSKNELEKILDAALEEGGDFAEIFVEKKFTTGIGCEDNRIEQVDSGVDLGAGMRVIKGDTTSYAYTNDLSLHGLMQVANIASRAAAGSRQGTPVKITKRFPQFDFDIELPPDMVPVANKVEQVERANRAARRVDERIKQVSVGLGDVIQDVVMANSDGIYVEDKRIRTRFVVNAVGSAAGQIQTGFESLGGTQGFEIFRRYSTEELAEAASRRALLLLEAAPAPAGKMPVVMSAEAGGTMVHEACGHGLEADLVQKKLSVYGEKIGQQVASPLVTVVDDATIKGKYGTLRFDDEGNPGQKKTLIDKGILKGFMYDNLTAKKSQRPPTGNGRRESFKDKPIPRMTNTYIAPGKDDPEKIIQNTTYGLLVRKMGGGQVNTTNGDFVFDVAEGYMIQDGEVTNPVRGATLTGNGPETLTLVDRIGKDLGFAIGTCGKDGQGVPVSDAQPTIRIKEMIVGGTVHVSPSSHMIRRL